MRFVTCLGPDGVEEPAVLSADGTAVTPLRWLGLPCDTLTEAIPQLTPAVRAGLALALSAIPSVPLDAVQLQSPIPCPAQDVVCLGINYMAHSDEAEKYSATPLPPSIRTPSTFPSGSPVPCRTAASSRPTPTW